MSRGDKGGRPVPSQEKKQRRNWDGAAGKLYHSSYTLSVYCNIVHPRLDGRGCWLILQYDSDSSLYLYGRPIIIAISERPSSWRHSEKKRAAPPKIQNRKISIFPGLLKDSELRRSLCLPRFFGAPSNVAQS